MKHARSDYDRIQDPAGLIPDDEPVFLLRGQDRLAPDLVEIWARSAEAAGAAPNIVAAAREQVARMLHWQLSHGDKLPDMPEGAESP